LRPAPEFEEWLVGLGAMDERGRLLRGRSDRLLGELGLLAP
jgi:ethanolamine ammonia-lyase large subunit